MSEVTGGDLDRFLEGFFAEGNDLTWASFKSSSAAGYALARRWVKAYREKGECILLPRRSMGRMTWYAIAENDSAFRLLRDLLTAFVGPSYSTFRGEPAVLALSDPVERAVEQFAARRVFRLDAGSTKPLQQQFVKALELMWSVLYAAEARPPEILLPTGRLLRDFNIALAAGERAAAQEVLSYLRTQERLDAINLHFLEVQFYAASGEWREVITLPFLADLLQIRRPLAVTQALIRAVYQTKLARFEENSSATEAARFFREEICGQYGALYQSRAGLNDADAVKSFMLLAVSAEPPNRPLCDELLSVEGLSAVDKEYIKHLSLLCGSATTPPIVDLLHEGRIARDASDFDRAAYLLMTAPPSVERASILLQCAYELRTTGVEREAVRAVQALTTENREQLLKSRTSTTFWHYLLGGSSAHEGIVVPISWTEWLLKARDPRWDERRALDTAATGAVEWPLDDLCEHPEQIALLLSELDTSLRDTVARSRLYEAFPHLVKSLENDEGFPRAMFADLYETLRLAIVYEFGHGSPGEFALYVELFSVAHELGLDHSGYVQLLEEAQELWERQGAPALLQYALDLVDQLYYYPCPSQVARTALTTSVFRMASVWKSTGRASPDLGRYAQRLAEEAGLGEMLTAEEPGQVVDQVNEDPLHYLHGVVAIHTLMEGAAVRVKRHLEARCPQCCVRINTDKVATSALRELSRSADVFVLVTGSSKHAASQCVESNRPAGMPLLRSHARGTSGVLHALEGYAMR